MEIVNKYFKRKGTNDNPLLVTNVESGFAHFDNNARCKLETLFTDFELVENTISLINESVSKNEYDINPDTFFETQMAIDQLEILVKNAPSERTIKDIPSVDLTSNKVISNSVKTESDYNPPSSMLKKDTLLNSNNNDFSSRLFNDNQQLEQTHNNYTPQQSIYIDNEPSEYKTFKSVKRTENLILDIPFQILMPKAQKLDVLNDLFEHSFIEYLAKQEVSNILKDPKILESLLIEKMEEWLEFNLTGKVKPKKKKIVKTTTKKQEVSKISTKKEILETKIISYNQPINIINNDQDLEVAKKRLEYLSGMDSSVEIDVELVELENLIITYTNGK